MTTKTISLRIQSDLDRLVRVEAARRDLNRSAFIRDTLVEKLGIGVVDPREVDQVELVAKDDSCNSTPHPVVEVDD